MSTEAEKSPSQEAPAQTQTTSEVAPTPQNRHWAATIARGGLTAVMGVGLVAGGTFLGYEFASIGVERQSFGEVADTVARYLGATVGGAMGAMATVEVAPYTMGE